MSTESHTSSQDSLEKAMQAQQAAQRLQRDRLTLGADYVNVDVEDADSDWLEKWGEDEEELFGEIDDELSDEVDWGVSGNGNQTTSGQEYSFTPLTPEQQYEAIERVARWVQDHPEAEAVRTQYLTLVENQGTLQQKQACIAQTACWLQSHLDAASVREKYLILVGKSGTPQQQQEAIAQTASWLKSHPEDRYVREQYLVLLGKSGTPQQQQEAIAQTATWLQSYPDDRYVRAQYLMLVGKVGTPQQQQACIAQTASWLQSHPDNRYVQQHYLELKGKTDKSGKTLVNLGHWFEQVFEAGWQAVEEVLGKQEVNLVFGFRNAEVRRAKLIRLGTQPESQAVALSVALKPEEDGKIGILLRVHPTGDETYLPEQLKLILLSSAGEVLHKKQANSASDLLEVGLGGQPGENFSVRLALGDVSVTEDFVI